MLSISLKGIFPLPPNLQFFYVYIKPEMDSNSASSELSFVIWHIVIWLRLIKPEIVWFLEIILIYTIWQVAQCSLRDLLLHCCVDDAPDVRQSAFALLGDLARVSCMYTCIHYTQAHIAIICSLPLVSFESKSTFWKQKFIYLGLARVGTGWK